jgi:phage tail-like protein
MRSTGIGVGFSTALGMGASATGFRLDPYQGFNFSIEIESLLVGGFTEMSGLESEVETEEYREGGVNHYVHKLPSQSASPNLVLTHGVTAVSTLWNWYYNVTQGIIQRKSGTIMLLDARSYPVMWWNFFNAYPVKWTGPQFKADSNEVIFESIELVHEGITKPILGQLLGIAQTFF